jgi:hypothetical protein
VPPPSIAAIYSVIEVVETGDRDEKLWPASQRGGNLGYSSITALVKGGIGVL